MSQQGLQVSLVFNADDQAWIRREGIVVPPFWQGHDAAPAVGDVVRFGGRQFVIQTRVWENDGTTTLLRLFVGDARAQYDTWLDYLSRAPARWRPMPSPCLTVLQNVPWSDVIKNAPKVADGARKLWQSVGKKAPPAEAAPTSTPVTTAPEASALAALESRAGALESA